MLVPGKPFQSSLMFASKAEAYLSEASFRCSTQGKATGLSCKHQTRLERPARDKYPSLVQTIVDYSHKKLYNIGLRLQLTVRKLV